jgi:transposase
MGSGKVRSYVGVVANTAALSSEDNLQPHKHPRVRQAIEAAGATLVYLPPYSPDFNPIEPMWSKVK